MPDQPDDPIHYEMKIPPEPKDAPLNKEGERHEKAESSKADNDRAKEDRSSSDRDRSPDH